MAMIKDEARDYEPQQTKNIAELEVIPTDIEVVENTFTDSDGKEFTIKVITVNGEDYRVPVSVLKSLKVHLGQNPNLKAFKVIKTGEGMKTAYTVVPL